MTAQTPTPEPAGPPGSAGEAAKAVTEDVRRLVRAEVALAKAEVGAVVKAKTTAIGLLVGAAVLGLYILFWLTYALFAGWNLLTPAWLAGLLTAMVLGLIAAGLGLAARRLLQEPVAAPERAVAAAQRTADLVKQRLNR